MTIRKLIAAAALAAPAMAAFSAAPAHAQAAGIATAEPTLAVWRSKAYAEANKSIDTTFKDSFDKLQAKRTDQQKALGQLDKNGDKNVDQAEFDAARVAKNPAFTQYEAIDKEIQTLTLPMARAQAFAVEMILKRYREAQDTVVKAKKINVILAPESFVYAPQGTDVTEAITTELDRVVPTVPITAPDNWRPTQETMVFVERLQQYTAAAIQQVRAQQQQQQQAAAAGGTRPAAPAGTAPATAAPAAAKPQPPGR